MPAQVSIPNLKGKIILITGGNAGIGAATVRALAAHNPTRIYICSRSRAKAEPFLKDLRGRHSSVDFQVLQLDLSSFDSIKACAAAFFRTGDHLDLLFLNAGVAVIAPALTSEGYEMQFGVNHMGHALLTQLLMPKLLQTSRGGADVRIVVISSDAANHFLPKSGLALGQMHAANPFSSMTLYSHSKLANVLFAAKLAETYRGITTTAAHPGTVKSEIWGKGDGAKLLSVMFAPVVWLTGVSTEEGARSQLWCGTAERKSSAASGGVESGSFYVPVGKKQNRPASDRAQMEELWRWTNEELARHGAPGWPEM